jgi:tungstate transport system substrate-binding protein
VSQKKFKTVNSTDTTRLSTVDRPEKGTIDHPDFGKEKYGAPLFFPNSEAWQKAQKK